VVVEVLTAEDQEIPVVVQVAVEVPMVAVQEILVVAVQVVEVVVLQAVEVIAIQEAAEVETEIHQEEIHVVMLVEVADLTVDTEAEGNPSQILYSFLNNLLSQIIYT